MSKHAVAGRAQSLLAQALMSACLVAGCAPTTTDEGTQTPPEGNPAASGDFELRIVDRRDFDATIKAHHGKVVLVDFWATWCGPCVEQLPHTLELASRLRDRGLAVVTVSCDEPSELLAVTDLLRAKGAGVAINCISTYGGSPQTMTEFEVTNGTVPFYALYDRTGRRRHTFGTNPFAKTQFKLADIDAAVEQLLAE
jgi:thiol-disulfide isomerase/thioredoxin